MTTTPDPIYALRGFHEALEPFVPEDRHRPIGQWPMTIDDVIGLSGLLADHGLQVTPIPDANTRQRTFGVRWLRNGDHPGDALGELLDDPMGGPPYERLEGKVVRFFRSPDYPGEEVHESCGHRWHDHGWLDFPDGGETVCPGDWVVIDAAYLGRTD